MLRKTLFWGLTLVLMVVLVNLILRERKLEKERARQMVEIVQESKPSATRVLGAQDLEIVQSKMILESESGTKLQSRSARHEIVIRNNGTLPYGEIQLKFEYFDKGGKTLLTKTHSIARTLMPGATVELSEILIDDLPDSIANSRVAIAFADIGHAPEHSQPVPTSTQ